MIAMRGRKKNFTIVPVTVKANGNNVANDEAALSRPVLGDEGDVFRATAA